jgi:septal ring-binding cell division protein DamX
MIKILPPTEKQQSESMRFGYTIQVMAVGSSQQALSYANQLPAGNPVWEHYKQVKGNDWHAVLYGDYATKSEAKAAIQTLPKYFRDLKPFVKSLDEIKNSNYPKLVKLR